MISRIGLGSWKFYDSLKMGVFTVVVEYGRIKCQYRTICGLNVKYVCSLHKELDCCQKQNFCLWRRMSLLKRATILICSIKHLKDDDSSRLLILLAYLSDHNSLFHNL